MVQYAPIGQSIWRRRGQGHRGEAARHNCRDTLETGMTTAARIIEQHREVPVVGHRQHLHWVVP
jgi:hypothetical protein